MNNNNNITSPFPWLALLALLLLGGCASTPGPTTREDPWEGFNRSMFEFNDGLDRYAFKPVAQGYDYIMPGFASTAVTNFFSNLDDFVVVFNQVLQGKFHQALETSARIVFNSTFGIFGLIDVATHMNLPKRNEDFGQTLAVWGVPSGPYVVLPVIGPRTVRDTGGLLVDWNSFDPVFNRQTTEQILATLALKYTDTRAGLLSAGNIIDTVPDRYAFVRDAWLLRREFLVYDGNPPKQEDDFSEDELFEEENLFQDDDLMDNQGATPPPRPEGEVQEQILQQTPIQNNMEITIKGYKPRQKSGGDGEADVDSGAGGEP